MVCWSTTPLNGEQVVLSSPFQGLSLLLASDGLLLAGADQENIAKVCREDRNKYRVWCCESKRAQTKFKYNFENESCVDCHSHSSEPDNNVWCDTKCFSNRYEITRYPPQPSNTPHNTPHIAQSITRKQNIMNWNFMFHVVLKFCFSLVMNVRLLPLKSLVLELDKCQQWPDFLSDIS